MNVLVLAPHQDDEVLGCGGTLAKLAERNHRITIASLGLKVVDHEVREDVALRYREQLDRAAHILGATNVVHGTYETEIFHERWRDLMVTIHALVHELKPYLVFIPWDGDLHQDHRTVSEAARFSLRGIDPDAPNKVLMYEIPGASGGDPTRVFAPNVWVPLNRDHVVAKQDALACYEDELREWPHPRSREGVEHYAQHRGMDIGREFAEAFMLYRDTLEF